MTEEVAVSGGCELRRHGNRRLHEWPQEGRWHGHGWQWDLLILLLWEQKCPSVLEAEDLCVDDNPFHQHFANVKEMHSSSVQVGPSTVEISSPGWRNISMMPTTGQSSGRRTKACLSFNFLN